MLPPRDGEWSKCGQGDGAQQHAIRIISAATKQGFTVPYGTIIS
jgi:hypothetical protein